MKKEQIFRDSQQMVEDYVENDLNEFISVEKYKLLEAEAKLRLTKNGDNNWEVDE